jgi:hypothetical protein
VGWRSGAEGLGHAWRGQPSLVTGDPHASTLAYTRQQRAACCTGCSIAVIDRWRAASGAKRHDPGGGGGGTRGWGVPTSPPSATASTCPAHAPLTAVHAPPRPNTPGQTVVARARISSSAQCAFFAPSTRPGSHSLPPTHNARGTHLRVWYTGCSKSTRLPCPSQFSTQSLSWYFVLLSAWGGGVSVQERVGTSREEHARDEGADARVGGHCARVGWGVEVMGRSG